MAEPILLGLDLGTTMLAGRLSTAEGKVLAEAEEINLQNEFGDDVIRRLEASLAGHADELQELLAASINRLSEELHKQSDLAVGCVTAAAAASNPAITHLLVGQSVDRILFPPHRSNFSAGTFFTPQSLNINLRVPLYLFPLISGYVGGDLVAVLLAGEPAAGPTIYLDLGTNAELALWDGDQWLVTSVAAGPAFEAGHLSCGMRHGQGAIRRVHCDTERFVLEVADKGTPLGFCGSGFFSALTAALDADLIDQAGRIRSADEVESGFSRYLVEIGGGALQLYRDAHRRLLITQQDVRAFQMAKGAVAAGIDCLLQSSGLKEDEIVSVAIAGALGAAMTSSDLKGVAMIPEIMLDNVRFLPSAVLDGLQCMLAEEGGEKRVQHLAAKLKPYPLSGTPAFEQSFLQSLNFV